MKKTVLWVMIITILSKIFGFGRDITLAYIYGASNISDAYIISTTIPSVIFGFVSTGITAGFIPIYSTICESEGKENANKFSNNILNAVLIICTVIIVICLLFTRQIVSVFASGFDNDTLNLTIAFTRVSILAIYFNGIIAIAKAFLQTNNNYIVPALIGLPLNIIVIISIILSQKYNLLILSLGFVLSVGSQVVFMIPSMKKLGFKYKLSLNLKSKHVKNMLFIAAPVIAGISVNQINILVDRTIASSLAVGGISALTYANKLILFLQGVFVMSLATVLYPQISKMVAKNNHEGVKTSIRESINVINIVVLPATLGSMILAEPIVKLLFGRGAFEASAISLTTSALFFYSIGLTGYGLREILSRVFYSMQDSTTPMKNAVVGVLLNIILNIILSRYLGIGGLALATSIAATFTTGLLFISLRKKIGPFGMKQISISFLKILFASLVMGGLAKLSFNYLTASLSQNLSLLMAIGVGAVSYFVIIYFMKIEDVDVIVGAIKKKFGRGAA